MDAMFVKKMNRKGVIVMWKNYIRGGASGALGIALLASGSAVFALDMPADKDIIIFHSKTMGKTTFYHKKHSTLEDVGGVLKVECKTCHHTQEGDAAVKPCKECHAKKKGGKMENAPKYKDAYHLRCRGCHKYTMEEMKKPAGPDKKCKLCHVKPPKKK